MSCSRGTFCKTDNTWSSCCGNLRPGNWSPYGTICSTPANVENYGSCTYNSSAGYGKGCGCGSTTTCQCGPYNKLGKYKEGLVPDHKENYYAGFNTAWTVSGNVTQANSGIRHQHGLWNNSEKYQGPGCYKTGPYVKSGETWDTQKKYTSG